jgi:hypothetical protein
MNPFKEIFSSRTQNYLPAKFRCEEKGSRTQFIIHHYCPHTFNAGDHFVVRSIRMHLQKHLPEAVFVPKAVASNRGWGEPIGLRGVNIRNSNELADAVILGGSDQYNNWSPRIKAEEIRYLKPPLFFVGLGVSSKDLDQPPYISKTKYLEDILAANRKTVLSSVRDDISAEFLRGIGFDSPVVTGCPALYLFDEPLRVGEKGNPVLLSFPYPMVRGESQWHKYRALIEVMEQLIAGLVREGEDCLVVCHDDRDVREAQECLEGRVPIFFSNYADDYFRLYKNAKMVVGSRLHATILALGMGVPSVNIDLDLRGQGFSRTFGLEEWNLSYKDPKLLDKLKERMGILASGDLTSFAGFEKQRTKYKAVFGRFIADTAAHIRGSESMAEVGVSAGRQP